MLVAVPQAVPGAKMTLVRRAVVTGSTVACGRSLWSLKFVSCKWFRRVRRRGRSYVSTQAGRRDHSRRASSPCRWAWSRG